MKTTSKKEREKFSMAVKEIVSLLISLLISVAYYLYSKELIASGIIIFSVFVFLNAYFIIRKKLESVSRIKKIESAFPDFIELMASNLRAGMTIDKALLLSSRKEFSPLDSEILILGKDILTGKEITRALSDMSSRIGSEKIEKTLSVIITGIRSGGNLAVLLEETALNMRERSFIEKRAASNVLMYLIFIFFAVAIGSPALFSLSSMLVEIFTAILGNLPQIETSVTLPVLLTSINLPLSFIKFFSITFLIAIDILAAMLLGLVNKGEEKEGVKYVIPLIIVSIGVYFAVRLLLANYFKDLIS